MSAEMIIGRVLRASTRGFDCGAHSRNISDLHDLGMFVKAPVANDDRIVAVGVVYKMEIKDDQLISELVMGDMVPDQILRDQRDNRMIPVEIKVLNVGYMVNGVCYHSLPPRPPMSLCDVYACNSYEVAQFTQALDYFRIILQASEVPTDDLISAAIRYSAFALGYDTPEQQRARYDYYVTCGQRLARELSHDLKRLSHILSLIRPY